MPKFSIYCRDKKGTAQTRREVAPKHLSHVEKYIDRYLVAGPMRDIEGETVGSLLIVTAEHEDDARQFLEQDPYFAADIWESIEIHNFMAAAGEWIGGKIW